jgi:hypothetical protein
MITADSGGSNGSRVRLWKWELQRFADDSGLTIHVRHLPPGTSKWNKIEHRLFSFISQNWQGRPLLTLATIVNLIGATRTTAGLRVHAGPPRLSNAGGDQRGPDAYDQPHPRSLSRRVELHHLPETTLIYFIS